MKISEVNPNAIARTRTVGKQHTRCRAVHPEPLARCGAGERRLVAANPALPSLSINQRTLDRIGQFFVEPRQIAGQQRDRGTAIGLFKDDFSPAFCTHISRHRRAPH